MPEKKSSRNYQLNWVAENIFDPNYFDAISENVQIHEHIDNVMSSAAACINVFGYLSTRPAELVTFLNNFGLGIDEVFPFPSGADLDGEIYDDSGYVIFEWIGPGLSPINEQRGRRGQYRTSIDAYVIAKIDGKITQLIIEWKFTESYTYPEQLQKFAGLKGNERLRRYSSVLAKMRRDKDFPFIFKEDGGMGLYDFGYEPIYQLLRMTLLAKTTTPLQLDPTLLIEDYRIVHLSHSENTALNVLTQPQLALCPGLANKAGSDLHIVWKELLAEVDQSRFYSGYWDKYLSKLESNSAVEYLVERYGT